VRTGAPLAEVRIPLKARPRRIWRRACRAGRGSGDGSDEHPSQAAAPSARRRGGGRAARSHCGRGCSSICRRSGKEVASYPTPSPRPPTQRQRHRASQGRHPGTRASGAGRRRRHARWCPATPAAEGPARHRPGANTRRCGSP